jgi:hypothetical protein
MVITSSGNNIIQLDGDLGYEPHYNGYDDEKVKELQMQLFQNFKVVSVIRDYHNVLRSHLKNHKPVL